MNVILRRKELVVGLIVLIGALIANAWVGYGKTQRVFENSGRVSHTHEVLAGLQRVLSAVVDAETAQRGFIITRDEKFLETYHQARQDFSESTTSLRKLTADNAGLQERIFRLETHCAERFAILDEGIDFRKAGREESAHELVADGRGASMTRQIRAVIEEMDREARGLLAARDQENRRAYESALQSGLLGVLLTLGAVAAFLSLLARYFQVLSESAAALQEADRRKDEFLATLAHELRNPLAPLSNALQIWEFVDGDQARSQELQQIMRRQVQQMSRLVDDLLDVSRITRGKIELKKEPVDLETAIAAAVEAVQPLIESSQHELTVDVPRERLAVAGDVARLTQIFGNILQNAAKFTPRNGCLEINARREGREAIVSIRDNGPGIPTAMLTQIFEMFRQADQTLERSQGGLGIGLTLVKRLVELHGGRVEARSKGPRHGSEFVVTLPLLMAPSVQANGHLAETADAPGAALGSLKLLVVDDVRASGKTLALMLQAIGQHTEVLDDGAAAVEWINANRPDVVFLDIAMPGMSGYDVARKIRRNEELRDVYLVALTGYGQDEDRRRALDAGFDEHLTKPTSIDALRQLLGKLAR